MNGKQLGEFANNSFIFGLATDEKFSMWQTTAITTYLNCKFITADRSNKIFVFALCLKKKIYIRKTLCYIVNDNLISSSLWQHISSIREKIYKTRKIHLIS